MLQGVHEPEDVFVALVGLASEARQSALFDASIHSVVRQLPLVWLESCGRGNGSNRSQSTRQAVIEDLSYHVDSSFERRRAKQASGTDQFS